MNKIKNFTKSMLEVGMAVTFRGSKTPHMVPYSRNGRVFFKNFSGKVTKGKFWSNDLTVPNNRDWDVVKVSKMDSYTTIAGTTLWERSSAEEMTIDQICKELGRDIKVVK